MFNLDHPKYADIRRGRKIRTDLAQELCEQCEMKWDEVVSVESFPNIENILKCNFYFFLNTDNIPVLNTTMTLFHSMF